MSVTNTQLQNNNDTRNETKPDYIIKIRTDSKTLKSGRYGYYTVGAAWLSTGEDGNIYLDINFPNPFLVDNQTKIVLFPNSEKE